MELIIHGPYIEYHLQRFTTEQYQRIAEYCKDKFSALDYDTEEDALNSLLVNAWGQSVQETDKQADPVYAEPTEDDHSFHFFVYPTGGDYSLADASFRKTKLCEVFGVDKLMPDFVISGHNWAADHRRNNSLDFFIPNNSGKNRYLLKSGLRLSKKKHALALAEDTMTFFYCKCWDRVQLVYELPCKKSSFRKTKLGIEIVRVGSPVDSGGIVQRVSYNDTLLDCTDFTCWTGWDVYTGWWSGKQA